MRLAALTIAATLALTGCATSNNRPRTLWTAEGPSVACINPSQIRSTHVRDDRTINFVMSGRNRKMRNELPFACSGLGFIRAFRHDSRTSQLCSVDTITVIQPGTRGASGPRCGLGRFQPMVPVSHTPTH